MSYVRTPEHRRLRAALIRRWRPWEQSTGPQTAAGKSRASRNAWKGGWRQQLRELSKALDEQRREVERITVESGQAAH